MTDLDALTLTIWGEARGEPIEGKIGVAMVVRNRVQERYRGAATYSDVCRAHAQFSAWTEEAAAMQAAAEELTGGHPSDATLRLCEEIAKATIAGTLADNTYGATSYYAITIPTPVWAQGRPLLASLGHQRFVKVT